MKKKFLGIFSPSNKYGILLLIIAFVYTNDNYAQCTNSVQYGSAVAPTNTLPVTISTCNYQTEYSPITAIVSGTTYQISNSCGGYITVRSNTYNGTVISHGNSPHTFTATSSGTYYVHYNTNAACGTASNCCTTTITCTSCSAPVAPSNDLCSNATPLPCGTTNLAGTTVGTTNIANVSGCSMSNYGVWYSFVGDGQNTTITTNPSFDIKLSVSTGTCGSMTNIVCTDFSPESASFSTINGTTYYVYVAHWLAGSTTTGTFTISRSCSAPIGNDNCSNAINLTVNPTTTCTSTTAGSTIGASQSMAGCLGNADDDVWFSFVATSTIHNVTVTPGTLSDAVLQVFSGTCGSLTSLACVDNTITGNESATVTGLTIGNTYYVRVYSYSNGSGQGTFTMCVSTPVNPCSSITNIASCGSTINVNVPSGSGSYPSSPCGWTTPGVETIYTFTPTQSGTYTIQQTNSFATIDYHYKAVSDGCNNIDRKSVV